MAHAAAAAAAAESRVCNRRAAASSLMLILPSPVHQTPSVDAAHPQPQTSAPSCPPAAAAPARRARLRAEGKGGKPQTQRSDQVGGRVIRRVGNEEDGLNVMRWQQMGQHLPIGSSISIVLVAIMGHPAFAGVLTPPDDYQYVSPATESRDDGGVSQGRECRMVRIDARCRQRQTESAYAAAHGGARGCGVCDSGGHGRGPYLNA